MVICRSTYTPSIAFSARATSAATSPSAVSDVRDLGQVRFLNQGDCRIEHGQIPCCHVSSTAPACVGLRWEWGYFPRLRRPCPDRARQLTAAASRVAAATPGPVRLPRPDQVGAFSGDPAPVIRRLAAPAEVLVPAFVVFAEVLRNAADVGQGPAEPVYQRPEDGQGLLRQGDALLCLGDAALCFIDACLGGGDRGLTC